MKANHLIRLMLVFFLIAGCQDEDIAPLAQSPEQDQLSINGLIDVEVEFSDEEESVSDGARTTGFTENFENGSKGSYSAASVSLSSGTWYFSDALIGSLSGDRKYGSKSTRIRNTGYITMSFNMDNGAGTVKVRHAKYGSDGNSTWRLVVSYDNGASWYYVGSTITTSSTSLQTVTYTVNETSAVRYGVMKLSGGSNRINIDNFEVTEGSGGGSACNGVNTPGNPTQGSHLLMGNPSNATTSSSSNYLHNRSDFVVSYNGGRGIPNWVSWHLSDAWTGTGRASGWKQDPNLPGSLHQASDADYTNSNFDRGHICPNMDRNLNSTASKLTLQFSNAAPQNPSMNQTQWVQFEEWLNNKAENEDKEIYIISGVSGTGGYDRYGNYRTSLPKDANVTVPAYFWKVALILPNGTDDVCRTTTSNAQMVAVYMQNKALSGSWTNYSKSVNYIESITGYDFFEELDDAVENALESIQY